MRRSDKQGSANSDDRFHYDGYMEATYEDEYKTCEEQNDRTCFPMMPQICGDDRRRPDGGTYNENKALKVV